jgi:ATP-dependent Clp protease ATP-binding subunit ClpA
MFERYTIPARRVVFHAVNEAASSGTPHIEPAHLLLGILREDKDLAGALIGEEQRQEQFKYEIGGRSVTSTHKISTVDLPLSNESKRALTHAAEEADRLKHRAIRPVHLLIGLLRLDVLPADVLAAYGVTLEAVRQHALQDVPKHVAEAITGPHGPAAPGQLALHMLVERLPESRLGAAARLLQALCEERVELSGTDSQGSFSLKYWVPGDQPSE